MAVGGFFERARRAFFSKPTPEQSLLKLVKGQPIHRVVELGIESLETTAKLLAQLDKQAGGERLTYTAIDPFDERPADTQPLTLAETYRQLVATGARLQMTPGRLAASIATQANSLADTDLLLLSSQATDEALDTSWYYLPRMCHPGTLVFRRHDGQEADDPGDWLPVTLEEIAARAGASDRRLAA